MKKLFAMLLAVVLLVGTTFGQGFTYNAKGGAVEAKLYASWRLAVYQAAAAGAVTVQVSKVGSMSVNQTTCEVSLPNGRTIIPIQVSVPIQIVDGASTETVTPTAVSLTNNICSFTATLANAHGAGAMLTSGTAGLADAIADLSATGGVVAVDPDWAALGGTDLMLRATCTGCGLPVFPNVSILDTRAASPVFWNVGPTTATAFSAPAALAAGTVSSSATVAGSASYAAGTIHVRYALVDIMGNEGPPSADYSFADTSAKAIVFTAPPAATGAVGWVPYIGLEAGSAGQEYLMPLFTQPTVLGAMPVSNGVCTLSAPLLVSGHYACAITNTTYNQTGSGATIAGYPVVTSPLAVGTGGLSTASYQIGNSNSHTVYGYVPGANPGVNGIVRVSQPFNIATAAGSTVPQVMGTLKIPAGFMNFVGRSIEVCGYAYSSTQGASTIVRISFEWDAHGSDVTTGIPVIIGGPLVLNTLTTGTTGQFDFCQNFTTTVAAATATGGTILAGHGYLIECALTTCATPAAGPNMVVAAVGSLNLAADARLHVIMRQTTSTTAVPKLLNLTVRVLN